MPNDELTWEADTKFVEDASEAVKLVVEKRRRFATCQEDSAELTPAQSTSYRSSVMKCVAEDRLDIDIAERGSTKLKKGFFQKKSFQKFQNVKKVMFGKNSPPGHQSYHKSGNITCDKLS